MNKNKNFKDFKGKGKRNESNAKSNNKRNGKYSPRDSREDRGPSNEMGQSITNDLSWYSHYPELTLNAGKLSMLYPAGIKIDFRASDKYKVLNSAGTTVETKTLGIKSFDIPGVMAINYVPTYGYSESIQDPLTQMSRTTFNHLVAATNRVPNYEYTDLTVYQLAMTNLIQFYYWMCRIYLVAGTFSETNLTWNKAVFAALDVDGVDITTNRSLLYSYIITFARRISAFPFPKSFDLFNRTATLVSNIYADGVDPKSQLYVFNPVGVYRWDTDDAVGASKLAFVRYGGAVTYDKIVEIGNSLLDAVQGSSDVQLMTSDILKVYANDLVGVNLPPENGSIAPVYDTNILTQIMNIKWLGTTLENIDITQATDSGALEPYMVSKPFVSYSAFTAVTAAGFNCRDMVNFLVSNPSEGTVIEGTRFKFNVSFDDTSKTMNLTSFGTEIVETLKIYTAADGTPNSSFTKLNVGPAVATSTSSTAGRLLAALTSFDWHPRVIALDGTPTSGLSYCGSFWDCSNYAFITEQQIALMNNAALVNLMLAFG